MIVVEITVLLIALIVTYLIFKLVNALDIKKVIMNSIAGIISLLILNALGFNIKLSLLNLVIVALTGFIGLALIIILTFIGLI